LISRAQAELRRRRRTTRRARTATGSRSGCRARCHRRGITAIAIPALYLGIGGSFEFLGIALLAAFAFVSLNQAVTAIFGRAGRLASLAVLALASATGIVSTLPGPLYAVADYLPTHGAVLGLWAAVIGEAGLYTGIAELAAWLVVGVLTARLRLAVG
jgi:putative membrane protein